MFILLELVDLDQPKLLALSEQEIQKTLDRVFVQKYFESQIADEYVNSGDFENLRQFLTYDERYMLNSYPDYKSYLRFRD